MAYSVEDIEGVGKVFAAKLEAAGIRSVDALLEAGKSPAGRRKVAADSGIAEDRILKFVNHCDLMRIKGVGPQISELLESAGVDTVKELRRRNAENLHAAMAETNAKRNLMNQLPGAGQVQGFIDQAKEMEPMVTY
jgi:predicted flap endonuclease-1-like 5' DNA nuclease